MLRAPDVYACACLNLTVIFVCRVSIDTPRAPLTPVVSVATRLYSRTYSRTAVDTRLKRGEKWAGSCCLLSVICVSRVLVYKVKKFYTAYGKHTPSPHSDSHTVPYMSTHVPIFPRARCKLRHRWDAIRHQIS